MRVSFRAFVGAAIIAIGAAGTHASVIFDTSLASPNATAASGVPNTSSNNSSWYLGNGNPQGGFTVSASNGIEIGMRAKYRQNINVIHSSSDVYTVQAGAQTLQTSGGVAAAPTRAAWNYEFSIDLRPGGVGTLTAADIVSNTTLTITDVTSGHTATVNPLTYWGDDTGYGSAGGLTGPGKHTPLNVADWGIQQSENPAFADFPLAAFFSMNALDTYIFQLDVRDSSSTLLASNSIQVQVVPVPASVWGGMMLLGLLGAYKINRRRLQMT